MCTTADEGERWFSGYIIRRTSKEDMRRGLISISEDGRQLIGETGTQVKSIYTEITRRYGVEKLARLQEMLRELETVLAEPIETDPLPARTAPSHRPKAVVKQRGHPVTALRQI